MATTIQQPPKIEHERLPSQGSGNGGWRNLVPAGGDLRRVKNLSPPPASTGIWVGLAAITMTFAAFTSALIVRQGAAPDWQHITLPPVLYLNSLLIVASSVTLETARRRIAAYMGGSRASIRESCALALHHFVLRTVFCRWTDACLGATEVPGLRACHQHQLLLLLRADGSPRSARFRRAWWSGARDWETESFRVATEHAGRNFALLAFYGRAVAVSAFAAVDEALDQSRGETT